MPLRQVGTAFILRFFCRKGVINLPCYHPKLRITDLTKWEKAKDGHMYHPARISKPDKENERLEDLHKKIGTNYRIEQIPCRNCIGCRLEYSRQWANRGYLEAKYHDENYFITLTYDDQHLPLQLDLDTMSPINLNGTLQPEDLDDFWHDLRQILKREYNAPKFKYMVCGEYGEEGERPHYHAICFGLQLPKETFYKPRIINKNTYWQNTIIERCWRNGISNITDATWNNIAYTARYITKKINGKGSEELYAEKGQLKEFFRVSKGIAKQHFIDNYEEIKRTGTITIKNNNGAVTTAMPKYYDNLLNKTNQKELERLKKVRMHRNKIEARIKDTKTSRDRLSQLEIEEKTHETKHRRLTRSFEESDKKRIDKINKM